MTLSSKVLAACLLLIPQASAHLKWTYPVPRVDSDTINTIGCNLRNPEQCGHDCGYPGDGDWDPSAGYAVTELPVGEPVELKWFIYLAHSPHQYRISINPIPGPDQGFNLTENLIMYTDKFEAAEYNQKDVSRTAVIPEKYYDTCSDPANPCTMQLWDRYNFISCANVVLVKAGPTAPTTDAPTDMPTSAAPTAMATTAMPTSAPTKEPAFRWPVESSVMLANKTGEPMGLGFCPDVGGSQLNDTLSCSNIHGGTCFTDNYEKSFGYTDNLTTPYIYATHFTGKTDSCAEIASNDTTSEQGCLTAIHPNAKVNRPEKVAHLKKDAGVALLRCRGFLTQKFQYTESGKFQIHNPYRNQTFCLGMEAKIKNATWDMGVERGLKLMDCDERTDQSLITWSVTPEPANPAKDRVKVATVAVDRSAIFDRGLRAGKYLRNFVSN